MTIRLSHVAIWTPDIERLRAFYEEHFGGKAGAQYHSTSTPGFTSYFITLPGAGPRIELMQLPHLPPSTPQSAGYAHVALSVGSRAAVDALAARLVAVGVPLASAPRLTGDGYYEAVVCDPDGNLIEITT